MIHHPRHPDNPRGSSRFDWDAPFHPLATATARQTEKGLSVIDLTHANPTQCGFCRTHEAVVAPLASPAAMFYNPSPKGSETARASISAYYRELGKTVSIDRILLTASTSEAYGLIFKLLGDPGDEILIPRPGYPLLSHLAGFEGLTCHSYPLRHAKTTGWRIDLEILEALVTDQTRAVVVVNPNNPTGNYIHPHDLKNVDAICQAHGMALIVDEVFADFSDTVATHPLYTTTGQTRALTFILNGISKMLGLPQMKLGWVIVDGEVAVADAATRRLETLMDFYLTVGVPIQLALPRMLQDRSGIQRQIHARITDNETTLETLLAGTKNMRRLIREGGWYSVVYVDDAISDEDRAVRLMETDQVLIHPGRFYEFDADGFVVLSLLPLPDQFTDGVCRMIRRFGVPTA